MLLKGIHQRHARTLNVLGKITLEKCYECILDAGLNPSDIEGTNTGLFLSYCFSEYEHYFYFKEHVKEGNTILGYTSNVTISGFLTAFNLIQQSKECHSRCC